MKKIYLTVFQNLLANKKISLEPTNDNSILIILLEALLDLVFQDLHVIAHFSKSSKPKKTLKFINLGLNLISKIISLNIEQTFLDKTNNNSQNPYNKIFSLYQKSLSLCHLVKKFLSLFFRHEIKIHPLDYESFFQNYMDANSDFYKHFSNCMLNSSSINVRMFLKTFNNLGDILNYFNFKDISISCSQISILIVSIGRELNFSEENKEKEKNLWNLTLQARISYILQKIGEKYKKVGMRESVEKIQESLEKNFLQNLGETKKYLKFIKTKENSFYIDDFKQNANIIKFTDEVAKLCKLKSLKLSEKTTKISIILAKVAKKYKKKNNLRFLLLQSEVALKLTKKLILLGLHAFGFKLLNEHSVFLLLSSVCKFQKEESISKETIQNCNYNNLAKKGILGITISRIWEMKPTPLKMESKSWFVENIVEKSVVFNDFWKLNIEISKAFRLILKICNEKTGVFSYSKYYEIWGSTFELKSLRIAEFFNIFNNSTQILTGEDGSSTFQKIFNDLFLLSPLNDKFERKQEFLGLFFPKRKSLSSKVSLSDVKKKSEKIFEGGEVLSNRYFIGEIVNFLLDYFHQTFSISSNTKNLELFIMKKLINNQFSLKINKNNEAFSFFQEIGSCHCKLFGEFIKNGVDNMIISTFALKISHNLHKINIKILENDFLMFFLNFLNKNKNFTNSPKLISLINLRNLIFILTNEISIHNIDLAHHYLYLFYQYEAKIFQSLSDLISQNKSEFVVFVEKLSNLNIFECFCDKNPGKKKVSLFSFTMKNESLLLMKFFNKPYDFKFFLKQIDLLKMEKSDKKQDSQNLRNSFKNLQIFDSETEVSKTLKSGFEVNIPNNLNQSYVRNLVEKNLGGNCLLYVKFLEENNEKILLVGRVNLKKKTFFSYRVDSQHKLNFMKDYIKDFHNTIRINEKEIKESSKQQGNAGARKTWWEHRYFYLKKLKKLQETCF